MATSIELLQNRTVTASGQFQLTSTIVAAVGFRAGTLAMFVYEYESPNPVEYQHVARVGDIEHLDEVIIEGYYRVTHSVQLFDTVEEAQAESDAQQVGMSNLVTDYDAYKATFETDPLNPSDETNIYTA